MFFLPPRLQVDVCRARKDPFGNTFDPSPMTTYEWAKMLFNYTIFPLAWIRAGLFIPLFITVCALGKLSTLGLNLSPENQYGMLQPQQQRWRRAIKRSMRYVIRAALFVAGFHRITVTGQRADPVEAPIVVSNHISLVDAALLFMIYDGPMFISKARYNSVILLMSYNISRIDNILVLYFTFSFNSRSLFTHSFLLHFALYFATEVRGVRPCAVLGRHRLRRYPGGPPEPDVAPRHAGRGDAPRALQRVDPPPPQRAPYVDGHKTYDLYLMILSHSDIVRLICGNYCILYSSLVLLL